MGAKSPLGAPGSASAKGRLSLNISNGPMTPVSMTGSPRVSTPVSAFGQSPFAVRFGRAAVLTAPPKLVAVVETPDVAIGAVDPRNGEMQTPLHVATTAGFADVAQALCRAGASSEALDASGNSPWAETQKDGFSMRNQITAAAAASVAEGGDGEIGKRYV